jgi:hypothetical protein
VENEFHSVKVNKLFDRKARRKELLEKLQIRLLAGSVDFNSNPESEIEAQLDREESEELSRQEEIDAIYAKVERNIRIELKADERLRTINKDMYAEVRLEVDKEFKKFYDQVENRVKENLREKWKQEQREFNPLLDALRCEIMECENLDKRIADRIGKFRNAYGLTPKQLEEMWNDLQNILVQFSEISKLVGKLRGL